MAHPVIHTEIRSVDPDATRQFLGALCGWKVFFVGFEDVSAALIKAEELGGTIIQPAQHVPGTSFGVFADAQGHRIGVAASA